MLNSGFESGLDPWETSGPTGKVTRQPLDADPTTNTDGPVHSGRSAMRLAGGGSGLRQATSALSPDSTYILTGWAKLTAANDSATLGVTGKFGTKTIRFEGSGGPSNWLRGSVAFTTGPHEEPMTVFFQNSGEAGAADVLVDDVGLVQSLTPEPLLTTARADIELNRGNGLNQFDLSGHWQRSESWTKGDRAQVRFEGRQAILYARVCESGRDRRRLHRRRPGNLRGLLLSATPPSRHRAADHSRVPQPAAASRPPYADTARHRRQKPRVAGQSNSSSLPECARLNREAEPQQPQSLRLQSVVAPTTPSCYMKTILFLTLLPMGCMAANWPLNTAKDAALVVHGESKNASGVSGGSLVLDGSSVIELKDSAALNGDGGFTFSVWFNPYALSAGQQVIAGKNRYSRDERQWTLAVEPDGKLKAYLKQGGWSTIGCAETLQAGQWHLATLTVGEGKAALYLNGKPVGEVALKKPVAATQAPITLGGSWDGKRAQQQFLGAVDEARFEPRMLSAAEVEASYQPVSATHELPKPLVSDTPLWDERVPLSKAADLPVIDGVAFHVIKKSDGAKWMLGVGLAWHKERLYASYGFNVGDENTPTEEAHVRVSDDGGKSWGEPVVMDHGEGNLGVSHGVFLSHAGKLWAFQGAFYDHFQRTHTRAYTLNESTGQWDAQGVVIGDGFWPMQEPQKMKDGNWIMSGARVSKGYALATDPPAVAISHGDDFTKWDLVPIPLIRGIGSVWGESSVIVEDQRIINVSRYGKKPLALISVSEDHGRTWTPSAPSNLPMATSKPYAGTLSTGQRYLVCTTTADTGGKRSPLTIAVSKPGENVFSKVFVIRRSVFPEGPGVSNERADFSYPYAVEHAGKLYVGYTHKSHVANELAVIPTEKLM